METLEKQYNDSMIKALKEIDGKLNTLLNQAGIIMVETTRGLQDRHNNYATRNLSNKTNYRIKGNTLTFGSNASNNGYAYGLVQEFGRKAGKWPNITAIEKWVRRKVQLGHLKINKLQGRTSRTRLSAKQRRESQIRGIAFIIARAIKKKGSKGRFYYKKGFEAGVELYGKKLNDIIIKAFE
jgi:hypothetical protein